MLDKMSSGFLLLFFSVVTVNSMSLKGPVLTRYDPCSSGTFYFEKVTERLWKGVIYLSLYGNVTVDPEIEISFKQTMTIYGASQESTMKIQDNWHKFSLRLKGELPQMYTFYVSITEQNPENVPVVTKYRFNNITLCDESLRIAENIEALNVTKENDTVYRHVCGRRSLRHAELMNLRTDSRTGDWPWHVAIMAQNPDSNLFRYQCGGNIISPNAILTAGHCLFLNGVELEPRRIVVEAGLSELNVVDSPSRQSLVAQRTILHPAYISELSTSDLAIIIVNRLRFNEFVQPICIWGPAYDKTALYGKEAVVVGFGTTEQNKLSDTLRATNIMVQNDATCIAYSPDLYKRLLNEFTFCAGLGPTSGINPRNGDSGGGLVVPTLQSDRKISWFLRGVLSKCGRTPPNLDCDPKYYVVYTDVGPHYNWIYHNSGLAYRSNVVV